jgi:hypothetical protein
MKRRAVVLVVVLCLIVGAGALWPDGSPAQGDADAEATAAQATKDALPTEVAALETEVAGGEPSEANCPDDNSLCAMLAYVPDVLARPEPPTVIVEYGNVAAQLDAVGATIPDSFGGDEASRWVGATLFAGPIIFLEYARVWPEDYFGFRIVDVEESLVAGDPPDRLIVLRGRFDSERVVEAWTRAGYVEDQVGTTRTWSIRGDHEMDLDSEAPFVFASMNYATVLDDGVLAFTSTAAAMADVVGATNGEIPSLADRSDLGQLLGSVEPTLTGAYVVAGADAGSTAELVLLAWTPGGPVLWDNDEGTPYALPPDAPTQLAQIALLYADGTDVDAAADRIAENLETMSSALTNEPYAEYFPVRSVSTEPGSPIVMVELQSEERPAGRLARDMLLSRDLGFLV